MSKVFYSWQSDLPANRAYLQECLENAISRLPNYELETATRNSRGAVDIAQTILRKIDEADMFVADLSIINPEVEGRKTPNPNVLYELGYAVGKMGEAPIVMVVNTATTDIAELPFDIRNRRLMALDFNNGNKSRLADELYEIIASHVPANDEPDSPYIYLELASHGSDGIKFTAYNDDDETYTIEAIEIDGVEDDVSRSLPAKAMTQNIHSSRLPRPPYSHQVDEISFIVSRLNRSFKIHQGLVLESRADEQFNLTRIDPNPTLIEAIPKRRPKPIFTPLDSTGDSHRLQVEDTQTHNKFVVAISGTVAGMWTTMVSEIQPVLERIGRAINDKSGGHADGEFSITSESGETLSDVVSKIYKGVIRV
jgi:hypothetical protein